MQGGAQVCLRCGKKAADHPSVAGRQLDDTFEDEQEGAGVPDLQLELGAPGASVSQASSGAGALESFGDDWGDEQEPEAAPSLQLDAPDFVQQRAKKGTTPEAPPVSSPPGGRLEVPPARISGRMTAKTNEGPDPQVPAPTRPGAALEIDPYEVKVLADYGPEPTSFFQAVPYAVRVTRRKRELRRALASVRAALSEAEARRDERLVELGALLRPLVENDPQYSAFAAPLASAEKTKQAREAALDEASTSFRDRAKVIDAEIAGLDAPLEAARREAEQKGKAAEAAESLRAKHEARRKRVEIDVRSAQAKLARPETPPGERSQAQTLIAAAQNERQTRAAEEQLATNESQQAEAAAALARRGVADIEQKILAARARRGDLEKEFARQGAVRTEGIAAASREVKTALLEIGKRTATAGPSPEGADIRRKAVADAEASVRRVQVDMEKHLRALDAADAGAVRKGLIVMGVTIAVLVSAFVAWRLLRSNPYLPDGGKTSFIPSIHAVCEPGAPCPSG